MKSNNVVISYHNNKYFPIIIDFGKCIEVGKSSCKLLTKEEQLSYREKYPHIAPEIVSGAKASFYSDIYSLGLIFKNIDDKKIITCIQDLKSIVKSCTKVDPSTRIDLLQLSIIVKSFCCKCTTKDSH